MKLKLSFLLTILFCLLYSKNTQAQLSKTHYLPPITSDEGIQNQFIYISTPKTKNVSFKIIPIGRPENEIITGTVSNTNTYSTTSSSVGSQLYQASNSNAVITSNKGYIIEANDVIYVSVRMRSTSSSQAAAIVSKGVSALGTNFRMGGFSNISTDVDNLNFISVMATENNTNVTFDEFTPGILINNYSGTLPININLNEGETYIVSVSEERGGRPSDLIGTLIKSDKPIVVNSGSATGSFHTGNARDFGMDQLVDASKVGKEYIFVKGEGANGWENILIVAHNDNTQIKINGNPAITTINKSEWYVIEGSNYSSSGNMYVETSEPAFAFQGVGFGSSAANQSLFFVPPLNCESTGFVDNIPEIDRVGFDSFQGGVTVVTKREGNLVIVENSSNPTFSINGPNNVTGKTDYVTYRITNLSGNVSVKSLVKNSAGNDVATELYCSYFNQNGRATSGGFYSGFPSAPEINFEAAINTLGNCIGNDLTLEAANTDLFDTFEWFFDDGSGEVATGDITPKISPIQPGRYKLVGTINCSGTKFTSATVVVSACPDDYDGDTIIDNIDDDIDNDGILNCDESIGNATLNISNINSPSIIFNDNSTNNSTTSIYTETETNNNFSGTNTGNFTSTINTAPDSKLAYNLTFNQNINFVITQNQTTNHTISEGEYFILTVNPNNKNITLIDPNDQLLVDTNSDDEFEAGITILSASEIKFKYKTNLNGANATFKFVANQVNQIEFKHQSKEITATSNFNGNIQLTCFSRDNDNDGIEDMFDLDSDNDGIPDLIETANDNDTDGVLNYLDIDSDNDGIYDLTEAGHNLTDANLDGILDNANANIGSNGLVDALETTPDAKILTIDYTVADTDEDTNFNFTEVDADNDDCFDFLEAGYFGIDTGTVNTFPTPFVIVDKNGKVTGSNGYATLPNNNYIIAAPINITKFEDTTFCENDTDIITIESTAESFKWEVFNGLGWNLISDDAIYSGSNTANLQITETPLTYDNYFYRVTLSRAGNSCPIRSEAIRLTVNPAPVLKANPTLQHCISENDTNPTVNLTTAENNISSTANVTFKYFEDQAGLIEITNFTSYPVIANTVQSVFVKVTSANNCTQKIAELILNVGETADNPFNETQQPVCDDFLDAEGNNTANNSDTDKISNFRLNRTSIISSINPPANTTVLFYENATDRNNSINEIDISNFRNNIAKNDVTVIPHGIQFPIYYKIVSTLNKNCEGLGQFNLQINERPIASSNVLTPIEQCDTGFFDGNFTNGSNNNIDLTQKIEEVFEGTGQNINDFQVTFFKTATAAAIGNITRPDFIGTPSQYTNDVDTGFTVGNTATQTIYLRILNLITGCTNSNVSFQVIINPLPVISNLIDPITVCDIGNDGNSTNGLAQNIDISTRDVSILGTRNANDFTVTYHKTQADLNDLSSTGINKNSYDSDPLRVTINPITNSSEEVLFIRLLNNTTNCAFKEATLTIIVNPAPSFETISNFTQCDTNEDGDDTNGIIQNIDLNTKIPEILGVNQNPNNYTVTFHTDPTDALTGVNQLTFPYQNTSATENIYVYIQNKTTLCVNSEATFQIIINPLPSFTIRSPQTLCLRDGKINIFAEDFSDDYNYQWKDIDGNDLNPLNTDDNIDITLPGFYTVTATTKDGTMCTRTIDFEVKPSQQVNFDESFITIDDDVNAIDFSDNISIRINNIDNSLAFGDYQFSLRNDDTGDAFPSIGFQDEPFFENLEGGIYTITVNDKNGCSTNTELQVSVIQFQKFITPNGDGINDTWKIKGANTEFYSSSLSSINIFNRYGKLVAKTPINGRGWDGTYNSNTLPADDYWFNVLLVPIDTSKKPIQKSGHFSLLKR
ncbi:T9SS type B sorting domain-containing protein [uncultured Polaribacter sp.]|uniref:T9SS type B sorting domain-containing protein n=1 Tax=uncultured Polaribacter sp. TaxID=174711 RepID=UPI0026209B90|nr:T9SS type B sorting domain-containing protein [uncultured Polaribacter sp.]